MAPICQPGKVTRGCSCTPCERLREDRMTYKQKRRLAVRRVKERQAALILAEPSKST